MVLLKSSAALTQSKRTEYTTNFKVSPRRVIAGRVKNESRKNGESFTGASLNRKSNRSKKNDQTQNQQTANGDDQRPETSQSYVQQNGA